MKLPVFIMILIIATVNTLNGQNTTKILLINISDSIPVAGAHIIAEDSSVRGTSNNDGICFISFFGNSSTIRISHLSFKDTTVRIFSSDKQVLIPVRPKSHLLTTFSVYANPVNIIPDKPWFVTSYLHCKEGLLLLAYPRRKLSNQSLFLLDSSNEIVTSIPWKEIGILMMDAAGGIWLKCNNRTWRVIIEKGNISIGPEMMTTKEFEAGIERINLVVGNRYYFGHYRFDNQWLDYYCYDADANKTSVIESIADPLGLILRETRDIFETNEFERRFGEMCFFAPVFAPIHKDGNGTLIFNFAEGMILFYDSLNRLKKSIGMDFYKDKNLKEILLNDPVDNRFFTLFEEKGIISVCEIDINTGNLFKPVTIPSFHYIDHLTVYQGQLYFLYNEESFHEYKKIFRMSLPGVEYINETCLY